MNERTKIHAIKALRAKFDCTLMEAKHVVDAFWPTEFVPMCSEDVERLRDQFAMAVLPKIIDSFEKYTDEQLSDAVRMSGVGEGSPMELVIAIGAYRMADAMLEARKK